MTSASLLIVDDEPPVLAALERAVRQRFGSKLPVVTCNDPRQALRHLAAQDFAIVLSDLRMPGLDGLAFLQQAAVIRPQCVRMMLTASADFDSAQQAINQGGVFRYLCKPWTDDELFEHLGAAVTLAASRAAHHHWLGQATAGAHHDKAQALEALRLEALEPGITQVDWGPNGEVLMPPLTAADD